MSEMDKELLEQIELIRKDSESIEVSDGISFDNMMRRLEAADDKGKVCDFEESKYKINKGNKLRKNWVAICTGIAGTVVAAVLLVTLLIGDIGKIARVPITSGSSSNSDVNISGSLSSYAEKMKVQVDDGVYVLSGYKELNDYVKASKEYYNIHNFKGYGDLNLGAEDATFGNESMPGAWDDGADFEVDDLPTEDAVVNENDNSDADYSDTNVRTEGVGEADIAKTDGEYIYYLSYEWGDGENICKIHIAKADGVGTANISKLMVEDDIKNALQSTEAYKNINKEIQIDMYDIDMLICQQKLLVVATPIAYEINENGRFNLDNMSTYTVVLTYDISDKTEPALFSSLTLEGAYAECKIVDGYVYIFAELKKSVNDINEVLTENCTEAEATKAYAPMINGEILPADCVYMIEGSSYNVYNIIAVMDMTDMSKFYDIKAVMGAGDALNRYVSSNNMYFISDIGYDYENVYKYGEENQIIQLACQSQILRFSYDKGILTPTGCVNINGNVGDEFDIDEYDGYLRMAVSSTYRDVVYKQETADGENGASASPLDDYSIIIKGISSMSSLYIYDENLQLVGSIPELQEEEEVYGVRFDGDIAYIVTYRQTDPLFTVDLSDPTSPKVMGALKIPGFSTYLHKWDDNKLVGIGYDAKQMVKISTYDITDKYDVKEVEVCSPDSVYWSEALYDHKAVFISPDKNLIGFSSEGYILNELGGGQFMNMYKIFSYVDGKLTEVISCNLDEKVYYSTRAMYIDEYIYIVCPGTGINVYSMNDYSHIAYVQ